MQEHQQCLGKEEKPSEEREDTKHTHKRLQCMIKNYHRSLSYGVLQKERERETEGNNLAEKDTRMVSLP